MTVLPFRPNVCLIVFNSQRLLFLGERLGEPGHWQFPQGGIEKGQSLEENALRELEEELGAPRSAFRLVRKLNSTHNYDFDIPPAYAIGKWRGQTQCFYLVEFTGEDSQIDLSSFEPELMKWKWCSVEEVKKLAEPKRLNSYLAPLAEFEKLLAKGLFSEQE